MVHCPFIQSGHFFKLVRVSAELDELQNHKHMGVKHQKLFKFVEWKYLFVVLNIIQKHASYFSSAHTCQILKSGISTCMSSPISRKQPQKKLYFLTKAEVAQFFPAMIW